MYKQQYVRNTFTKMVFKEIADREVFERLIILNKLFWY